MTTRTALTGAALGVLVASLAACGGSGTGSSLTRAEQRKIDTLAIDQIERKQELDVAKIGGHWLITKSIGSSPSLGPNGRL
jgi:hypothetical protein